MLQLAVVRCSRDHCWQVTKSRKQCSSCNPEPTPDHYFDNFTGFQYANASSTRQQCSRVERTRLVSRPTGRNTSFNASHLVRPDQLHHRYCLSRDWPLISQNVHSFMSHLSFGTVCLQKLCCAIRNIVLKDILRHSCLIAVTRPSDRYLTSTSAAFCRHTWCFINLLIIIIIIIKISVYFADEWSVRLCIGLDATTATSTNNKESLRPCWSGTYTEQLMIMYTVC